MCFSVRLVHCIETVVHIMFIFNTQTKSGRSRKPLRTSPRENCVLHVALDGERVGSWVSLLKAVYRAR